jgi:hypothetical protein
VLKSSPEISRVNVELKNQHFRDLLRFRHQGRCAECQSEIHVTTDIRSVGQPVSVSSPIWARDQILVSAKIVMVTLSATRACPPFVAVMVSCTRFYHVSIFTTLQA